MNQITEEQIKAFAESIATKNYQYHLFSNKHHHEKIVKSAIETAKWMQEQMQPEWIMVTSTAHLPNDNNSYWCEIKNGDVVVMDGYTMRLNNVKRYTPIIKPKPPKQ